MSHLSTILTALNNVSLSASELVDATNLSLTQIAEATRVSIKNEVINKSGRGADARYSLNPTFAKPELEAEPEAKPEAKPELTLTDAEFNMAAAFYQTSVNCCGQCNDDENLSYMNADDLRDELGLSKQAIGGLMSSLSDKCVISDSESSARGNKKLNDWVLNTHDGIMAIADKLGAHVVTSSKPDVKPDTDLITLQSLCKQYNLVETTVRRKLRKSKIQKPSKQWAWAAETDLSDIIDVITK